LNGGTVVPVDRTVVMDAGSLRDFLAASDITLLWITAGLFQQIAAVDAAAFAGKRTVISGGDVVNPGAARAVLAASEGTGLRLLNGYGPTENTTFSTVFDIANTISKPSSAPGFRTGDERLIKLTSGCGKKVSSLLTKQGRANGVLRVAVVGGGCSGLQYKMDLQDGPANRDILVESAGVRVVVDPKSALYVTGSELDYVDALQDGGFKVKNPNAATSCSCGESFSA
jgi:iron-sulfur cluster assembly protein